MPDQLKKEAKIGGFIIPEVTKGGTGFFRCMSHLPHTLWRLLWCQRFSESNNQQLNLQGYKF